MIAALVVIGEHPLGRPVEGPVPDLRAGEVRFDVDGVRWSAIAATVEAGPPPSSRRLPPPAGWRS